jgi:mono/diheme cytochrome c family protein
MAGLSPNKAVRAGAVLPLLLAGLLLLPGCTDSYPDDLRYNPRTDPLVIKPPPTQPTQLDQPGQLAAWIESLPSKGGQILDPTAAYEKRQLARVSEFLGKNHFDLTDEEASELGLSAATAAKDVSKQEVEQQRKKELESRKEALTKRIAAVEKAMADAGPKLEKALTARFGTPAKPKVSLSADSFDLDEDSLQKESPSTLVKKVLPAKVFRKEMLPKDFFSGLTKVKSTTLETRLAQLLQERFGRGDAVSWDDIDALLPEAAGLRLDPATLAEGSRLYRRHCLHCHGLPGDGRGPTAPWVNPHPRDYRLGKFKFTSSAQAEGVRKPLRRDLLRTLRQGIEGTSMPSFALLTDDELEQLSSYVIHLSLRGQAEYDVLAKVLGDEPDADVEDVVGKSLKSNFLGWATAADTPIPVPEPRITAEKVAEEPDKDKRAKLQDQLTASQRRGFNQFTTGTAQCRSCHNDFGRANDYKYDAWGTIVRPANLTAGIYRGGRRPLDLYYRIHSGINGAGMTAFGESLAPDDIWDIVNFLQAMPYPKMLPDEVREQVYKK